MSDASLMLNAYAVLNGVVYGLLLFLLSSGLTVVFGLLGVLNVAHASFYMLGAYLAFGISAATGNFLLGLLVAPLVVMVAGALSEYFLLRKVREFGHGHQLLLTLGLGLLIIECVQWVWGTGPHSFAPPQLLSGSVNFLGLPYPSYRLFICVMALIVLSALALILLKTKLGMVVRAAVSDSEMVSALGFNVNAIFTGVFAMGTLLAGIAGAIAGPMLSVYPGMAADVLVILFIVVVVGGLGSLAGALIASLMVGLLNSFGVLFASDFAMYFSYALLAGVLLWKPLGLFGEREA